MNQITKFYNYKRPNVKISKTIVQSALALFVVVMLSACPTTNPTTVEPPVAPTEPVVSPPEEAPVVPDDATTDDVDAATTDVVDDGCTTDEDGNTLCGAMIIDQNENK